MARKERSFAAKLAHAGTKHITECPVCHKDQQALLVVRGMRTKQKDTWRFKETHVKICSCNSDEFGL